MVEEGLHNNRHYWINRFEFNSQKRHMDNRTVEMEVFVNAAEFQSFSAAGRRLKLSPSAVSKLVTRIEDRLGNPPARPFHPHDDADAGGRGLSGARARRILADIAETEQIVAAGGKLVPRGLLRVNASVGFGERYLLPLVPAFLELYPEVQLDISLTDGVIGLIEERTDIAIRSGAMDVSSLKARKLLESRRVVVASPSYLARHGLPETPSDLANHNCFSFNFRRSLNEWPLRDPGSTEIYRLPASGNSSVNSGMIMRRLCLVRAAVQKSVTEAAG